MEAIWFIRELKGLYLLRDRGQANLVRGTTEGLLYSPLYSLVRTHGAVTKISSS